MSELEHERSNLASGPPTRCAVIVPTYNGAGLTAACLEVLTSNPPVTCDMTVVVVDDGSTDGSPAWLARFVPAVTYLRLEQNAGFAKACNAGAEAAGDVDYLIFLNNDTIPVAGWLDALVAEAEADPCVAIVGSKLLYPNGQVQHAGICIGQDRVPHHLYVGFPGEHPAVNRPKRLVAVTAASMLIRRSDFEAMAGFDTSFHNGYEDVDLCLRLGEDGREIRYCPHSVVYHLESVTRWPDGVQVGTAQSEREYDRRWRPRVVPDDIEHYRNDGLLTIAYTHQHPQVWTVAPELAVAATQGHEMAALEKILVERSAQVMDLLSEQVRAMAASTARTFPTGSRSPVKPKLIEDSKREHILGGGSATAPLVSILLPTKNGAPRLRELLPMLMRQIAPLRLELVAIDSSSSDDSIAVLAEYGARIATIPATGFNHGVTRNELVAMAEGTYLVFLSQHALPVDEYWLAPLVATLDSDPSIAGACSRVAPHADADILTRRDVERDLSAAQERRTIAITDPAAYARMSAEQRRVMLNFHTVSAALSASAVKQVPFRPVRTLGEDLLWAREVAEAGWKLIHEPASVVYHSHTYGIGELLARNVDDGIANQDILGRTLDSKVLEPMIRAQVEEDWHFLESAGLTGDELRKWQLEATLRRGVQAVGQWLGLNHTELPPGTAERFSSLRDRDS